MLPKAGWSLSSEGERFNVAPLENEENEVTETCASGLAVGRVPSQASKPTSLGRENPEGIQERPHA